MFDMSQALGNQQLLQFAHLVGSEHPAATGRRQRPQSVQVAFQLDQFLALRRQHPERGTQWAGRLARDRRRQQAVGPDGNGQLDGVSSRRQVADLALQRPGLTFRASQRRQRDGALLFTGEYAKILDPLEWFLGEGLKAGSVSAHLGDELYVEMRLVAELGIDEYNLSTQLQSRLAAVPEKIDEYIAAVNPPAYWRKVAFRYPRMVHLLHQQTRVG